LAVGCALFVMTASVWGQDDDYGGIKKKKVPITRKRTNRPIQAPLLAMRWQILSLDRRGIEAPVDPNRADWGDVDAVRILTQINQPGYFYAIGQTVDKNNNLSEPQIIFFNENTMLGEDSLIELPSATQSKYKQQNKYWWKQSGSAGRQVITLVFSRDRIDELERVVSQSRDKEPGVDYRSFLWLIQESSYPQRKILTAQAPRPVNASGLTGPFVTNVWNPNRSNNEMLVEIIEIKLR
jgi:hypothetical protein